MLPTLDEFLGSDTQEKKPTLDEFLGGAKPKPTLDEFLGTPQAPQRSQSLMESMSTERLDPYTASLVSQGTPEGAAALQQFKVEKPGDITAPIFPTPRWKGGIAAGLGNTAMKLVDFAQSPLGLYSAVGGAIAPKVVGPLFAASAIPQDVAQKDQMLKPGASAQQITEELGNAAINTGMMVAPGIRSLKETPRTVEGNVEVMPPERPATKPTTAEQTYEAQVVPPKQLPESTEVAKPVPPTEPPLEAKPVEELTQAPPTSVSEAKTPESAAQVVENTPYPSMAARALESLKVATENAVKALQGKDAREFTEHQHPFKFEVPGIRPEISKITDPVVRDAATKFYEIQDRFIGLGMGTIHEVSKEFNVGGNKLGIKNPVTFLSQQTPDIKDAVTYMNDVQDGVTPSVELSDKGREIVQKVWDLFTKFGVERNIREGLHQGELTGTYWPRMLNPIARKALFSGDVERSEPVRQALIQYNMTKGVLPAEVDKAISNGKAAIGNPDLAAQYGPLDLPAGIGVPRELRDNNLTSVLSRYTARAARRLAYYDTFESQPHVQQALSSPEFGVGATKPVQNVIKDIKGQRLQESENLDMAMRSLSAAALSTLTGGKDITMATVAQGITYGEPVGYLKAKVQAVFDAANGIAGARDQGQIREHVGNMESGPGGIEQSLSILKRLPDIANVYSLRNLFDVTGRGIVFGTGRIMLQGYAQDALNGKLGIQGKRAIDTFMPDGWRYINEGKLPPQEVFHQAAARIVGAEQGTYDYRELPAFAMEGSLGQTLRWLRFDIGRLNRFAENVVTPFLNGNPYPLLMSTVGMLLGGSAVVAMVSALTGFKDKAPTWKEILSVSKEKDALEALTYKLATLANMSSYGGVLGSVSGAVMGQLYGHAPMSLNNPVIQNLGNIEVRGMQFIQALNDEESGLDAALNGLGAIVTDVFQNARLINNHLTEEGRQRVEDVNAARDLGMFNKVELGTAPSPSSDKANPMLGADQRKFKETPDIEEAYKLFEYKIDPKFQRQSRGNIETLMSKYTGLKNNPYDVIPSLDSRPLTAFQYLDWIEKTQGKAKAKQLLDTYFNKEIEKAVKTAPIP